MNSAQEVGQIIKNKRIEKGFTQMDIARKLFISEKTVSRWECGLGYPSMYIIEDICKLLDITIVELLGDDSNQNNNDLIEKVQKKRTKNFLFCSLLSLFLLVILCVLSFFPLSYKDNTNTKSFIELLFNLSSSFKNLSILFFSIGVCLFIVGLVISILISRKKKISKFNVLLNNIFSFISFILSLLMFIYNSNRIFIFSLISILITFTTLCTELSQLIGFISLNNDDNILENKKKRHLTYALILIALSLIYILGLYVSLISILSSGFPVFVVVTFIFGVLSYLVFASTLLYLFKSKVKFYLATLIPLFVILFCFYLLGLLKVGAFPKIMDIVTYIGVLLSPSFAIYIFLLIKAKVYKTSF